MMLLDSFEINELKSSGNLHNNPFNPKQRKKNVLFKSAQNCRPNCFEMSPNILT